MLTVRELLPADFLPRNSWVIGRRLKAQEKAGAIFIPQSAGEFALMEILAVGPGDVAPDGGRHSTNDLRVGDVALVRVGRAVRMGPNQAIIDKTTTVMTVGDGEVEFLDESQIAFVVDRTAISRNAEASAEA